MVIRRRTATAALALGVAAGAAGVGAGAVAADGASQPPAVLLAPVRPDAGTALGEDAATAGEAVMLLTESAPNLYAGAWNGTDGRLVAGVAPAATPSDWERMKAAVGRQGTVVATGRSLADLTALTTRIGEELGPSVAGVDISSVGPDLRNNAVTVGLVELTDASRAELAARYGDAVNVRQGGLFRNSTSG